MTTLRRTLAVAVIASSVGCKTDDAKPTPPAPAERAAPSPAPTAPTAPSAPAASPESARRAGLIDAILRKEPQLANARVLAPLRAFDDRDQAQQSWCMAGTDVLAITSEMTRSMVAAGWVNPRSRGTVDRASISAALDDQGIYAVTISVGGRDKTCDGIVASALYHASTITIPPVPDGDRVR